MTQVETAYGYVSGVEEGGVLSFKNIPYAAAPTGEDRWSAPKPPDAWTGVRNGGGFGPVSWQIVATEQGVLSFASDATPPVLSEDCLSLNVLDTSSRWCEPTCHGLDSRWGIHDRFRFLPDL